MTRLSALLICAAIAIPTTAAADKLTVDEITSRMINWADRVSRGHVADDLPPERCFRDIADAKAAGIAGSHQLGSYYFREHPRRADDGSGGFLITLDDATWYCERYRNRAAFLPSWSAINDAALWRSRYDDGVVEPDDRSAGYVTACRAGIAAAKQAGIDADYVVELDGKQMPFAAAEKDVCDALVTSINTAIRRNAAAATAVRDKYAKHGAKGEKLELLIRYDGLYWFLPGFKRTDDPAVLAKAKVLFQRLEGDDPAGDDRYVIHTVRKFVFKGAKLKSRTERQFRDVRGSWPPAKAFK